MSFTPTNSRSFPANTSLGLKLTPSTNSYNPRTPRSPKKSRSLYESGLSLKRIIGTTVTSPTGFDGLSSSRTFAYTAGAAAVVVTLDEEFQYSQRFYRARPTAVPSINNTTQTPSTPTNANTANDSRNRAITALRESGIGFSPSTPTTTAQLDWADSPTSKTWSSRERIKAATCLSISRDGRFLAVGETGYTPRVLVFSLNESSDQPIVILNEHTFGVRAVAFSPDGRYLASLGNVNDGFLYVWAINTRTGAARLHSSNKCTSFIKGMVWMGTSLITVGTRHVKVWRVEDLGVNSPLKQKFLIEGVVGTPAITPAAFLNVKTLLGRNSLLGALVDTTFTCVAAMSERTAIICSDRGDICLLDDTDGQRLMRVAQTGFPITCLAVDEEARNVRIGGRVGMTKILSFDDLVQPNTPGENQTPERESEPESPSPPPSLGPSSLVALSFIGDVLVTVDSQHAIRMFHKEEAVPHTASAPLTAHHDSVQGVGLLNSTNEESDNPIGNSSFFTWSASGSVLFWDLEGRKQHSIQVELEAPIGEDELPNQCQVVQSSKAANFFVTGDRLGMLSVIESKCGARLFNQRVHNAEILGIAVYEDSTTELIASCSRDRTVQLLRRVDNCWTLIQTMDEHTASVCSIFFSDAGQKLVSASTDRTIQIRQIATREINGQEIMAAIPVRVITCKASPVSMVLTCNEDSASSFVVSMLDRTVATYDLSTGKLLSSFKATDLDGTEAVVMDSLVMGSSGFSGRPTILAGVSSTDKSVRVYDADNGAFLDREWGHTAAVTDVALLESTETERRTTLISTGSDGTIMIWDLSPRVPTAILEPLEASGEDGDASPPKEITSARPPLRRVLSKQELAAFQTPTPTTPTGRTSPPRSLRRKTSKYSMSAAQSPKLGPPPVPSVPTSYFSADPIPVAKRDSPRNRSRSPPVSPKRVNHRRPSLASLEFRGRTKSAGPASEFGSLNMATEQVCRTLRAYRKKLLTNESIREDALKELDHELRMTAKALGEKTLKNKALSETVLAGLLDQYSERLVSIFDEKLRLSLRSDVLVESPTQSGGLTPVSEGERRTPKSRTPSMARRASAKD